MKRGPNERNAVNCILALGAALFVQEALIMELFGVDDAAGGGLGALANAVILTALFVTAYAVIAPRFLPVLKSRRRLLICAVTLGVATFTMQCASHLLSHTAGAGPLAVILIDSTIMSVSISVFAAWLHYIEISASKARKAQAERRSVVLAIVGSSVFVAITAMMAPMLVSSAENLLEVEERATDELVDRAGRQRMYAQWIARLIAEEQSVETLQRALDWEVQNYEQLLSLVETQTEDLGPAEFAEGRVTVTDEIHAARSDYLEAAAIWMTSSDAAREDAALEIRSRVDAFVPLVTASLEEFATLRGSPQRVIEHGVFLWIIRLSSGLLVLVTLVPVIRLTMAEQSHLAKALADAERSLSKLSGIQGALDRHAIVSITDNQGKITAVNERYCEISGYSEEELIGQNHRIVNSGHHPRAFFVDMWNKIGSGRAFRAVICNRSRFGDLYWVDTTIAPIIGQDGRPESFVSVHYDITDLKNSEQNLLDVNHTLEARVQARTVELERAKLSAEAANNAKSNFLATMSHELRTPLTSVLAHAELIEEIADEEGRSSERDDARSIIVASQHLLSMISDILDFSKLEAGELGFHFEQLDPESLLSDVEKVIRPLVEKQRSELIIETGADLPELHTDPLRLKQCLLNLLSNAAKFTEAGTVRLVTRLERRGEIDGIRFEVSDTGIGMSEETLANLFQPFHQADHTIERKFGGTGLGLAITRETVERLQGDVSAASVLGEGSVMTMWIPVDVRTTGGVDSAQTEAAA